MFGFEEALGYTIGDIVRDKDGISAAVLISELASELRARGKTLLDDLESIHRTYGLFVSSQVTVTRPGAEGVREIGAIMNGLRAAKLRRIGTHDVTALRDYEAQTATRVADGHVEAADPPEEQRADVRSRRREPHHRAPERHRAEDQILLRRARSDGGRRAARAGRRAGERGDERPASGASRRSRRGLAALAERG